MIDTYCTLEDVKADLDKHNSQDDNVLQNYLLDAKSVMDMELGFSLGQETVTTKNFSGSGNDILPVEPLLAITQVLSVYPPDSYGNIPTPLDITWDCFLATTHSGTFAQTIYRQRDSFQPGRYNIQIVGAWGRSYDADTVPLEFSRLQRRLAVWMFRQRDAQYSDAIGTKQTGQVIYHKNLPQDIQQMIMRLRPRTFASRSQLDKPLLHRVSSTLIRGF